MGPFIGLYILGALVYILIIAGPLTEGMTGRYGAHLSAKTGARYILLTPAWPPIAIFAMVVSGSRGIRALVKAAEIPAPRLPRLRRGPREVTPGQLSIADGQGGELSNTP
jgi:hypothetical protein